MLARGAQWVWKFSHGRLMAGHTTGGWAGHTGRPPILGGQHHAPGTITHARDFSTDRWVGRALDARNEASLVAE